MKDERASRQILFAPFGAEAQARLEAAGALVVGVGATGSALAEGLTRAGVGALRLVDRDLIEASNLGRQALYGEADLDLPKAIVARERLLALRSDMTIEARVGDAGPRLLAELSAGVDLILDGTDNFATRYLINELACREGIPWIYSGAIGATAVSMPVLPGETACFRCLFPDAPAHEESCDMAGVLQPAVLQAASWSLTEALKILGGRPEALIRELRSVDLWRGQAGGIRAASPRPDCPVCVKGEYTGLEAPRDELQVARICSRSVQVSPAEGAPALDLAALALNIEDAVAGEHVLVFETEGLAANLFPDGRLILEGCSDPERARKLYRRLIG